MVDERQSIELGRRLGATWVVGGAVQRLGERVRVTAQTIAVEEGRTVSSDEARRHAWTTSSSCRTGWSRSWCARACSANSSRARSGPSAPTRRSPEAYEAYSRGMLNLRLATQESVERAIALVRAGARPRARLRGGAHRAGQRAAAARRRSCRCRTCSNAARRCSSGPWRSRPTSAEAHVRLGQTLATLGDTDAAEAAIRRGLALEPESPLGAQPAGAAAVARPGARSTTRSRTSRAPPRWRRRPATPTCSWRCCRRSAAISTTPSATARDGRRPAAEGDVGHAGPHRRRRPHAPRLRALPGAAATTRPIREYRRELSFLTHTDHALRDRSIIEVSQKLAAAYGRLGAADEARTFATRRSRRSTAGSPPAPTIRSRATTSAALHALQRRRRAGAAAPRAAAAPSWVPSRAGGCRAIPTSPAVLANPGRRGAADRLIDDAGCAGAAPGDRCSPSTTRRPPR